MNFSKGEFEYLVDRGVLWRGWCKEKGMANFCHKVAVKILLTHSTPLNLVTRLRPKCEFF